MDFDVAQVQIYERLEAMVAAPTGEKLRTAYTEQGSIVVGDGIAILSYPDEIDPHGTYNQGVARMGMQLAIAVGKPGERNTPERLALWCKDSGPTSVLAWLEAQGWSHPEFDELTVVLITFGQVEIAEIPYTAAFFDLDMAGSGG